MHKKRLPKKLGNFESELYRRAMPASRIAPDSTRRSKHTSRPKGFQFHPRMIEILWEYPTLVEDFFLARLAARRSGQPARTKRLKVELFAPDDKSKMHNYLYKVSYNGKNFFVKELLNPVYPVDAVTQFETHTRLVGINEVMRQWNARVLPYVVGWKDTKQSFLVSEWVKGIPLEHWLRVPQGRKTDEVYQRFLRMERFLKRHKIKDITTRNVLYNSKTDELIAIDLMPQDE